MMEAQEKTQCLQDLHTHVLQASQVSIMEDHEIAYPSLRQALGANWTKMPDVKRVNPVFYALQAMYAVQKETGIVSVSMCVYAHHKMYAGAC
jgi:hypothetical protein